jgi:hypothetical protein
MASSSTGGLVQAQDEREPLDMNAWAAHVLSIAAERFERRLAEEIARLRVELRREMHEGFAAIRQEMATQRVELLKWSLMFWVGQFTANAALLVYLVRGR